MATHLHREISGDGPPAIVQGPAWGPSSDYLRRTLVPLLGGLRVVTYDPRNTGASERVDEPDAQATARLVDDLEGVRRASGIDRPFLLVGHSHGGFVAMAYAVRHADRLAGLVLLNTALRPPRRGPEVEEIVARLAEEPRRAGAIALFRERGLELPDVASDRELARWMRRLMPLYFRDLEAMETFQRRLRSVPPPSTAALHRLPDRREAWVEEGLPEIGVPTLVMTGRWDAAAPPSESRRIHRLVPGSRLAILEESGHHPWAEEPEAFRKAVQRFLADLGWSVG